MERRRGELWRESEVESALAPFVNAQTIVFALLRPSVDNPGDASVLVVQTPNWYALNAI